MKKYVRLTPQERAALRRLYASFRFISLKALAKAFNISQSTACSIVHEEARVTR